ncbi:MAG: TonB family protein [Bacteroidota bacterium]
MFKLLTLLLCFCGLNAFSQTQSNPLIIKYDANWEVITSGTPYYTAKAWKDGDKWHKQDFYADGKIQMEGFYSDEIFKIKDGQFTYYHSNGQVSQNEIYKNNKREGKAFLFTNKGQKISQGNFKNDLPVDSNVTWFENGKLSSILIADQNGNGNQSEFYGNGNVRVSGKIEAGKKTKSWIVNDSNGLKIMELQYVLDSLTTTTCVDAAGKPIGGFCIYERPAQFKGGANGWRRFLEQNLEYPNYAQKKGIQGVVKVQFIVSKSGGVSDFAILLSPHESLSKEVLRLMAISPGWQPAIQFNHPVTYRHIQSITFKLE